MLIKGDDGEMIECEVISTTEKESSFQKSVPVMNPSLAGLFSFLIWSQVTILFEYLIHSLFKLDTFHDSFNFAD